MFQKLYIVILLLCASLAGAQCTSTPTVTSAVATPTATSATLTWTTSGCASDTTAAWGYAGVYAYVSIPADTVSGTTSHSVSMTNLWPGSTYGWDARSRGFTSGVPDNAKRNLRVTGSFTTSAPPNTGVFDYRIAVPISACDGCARPTLRLHRGYFIYLPIRMAEVTMNGAAQTDVVSLTLTGLPTNATGTALTGDGTWTQGITTWSGLALSKTTTDYALQLNAPTNVALGTYTVTITSTPTINSSVTKTATFDLIIEEPSLVTGTPSSYPAIPHLSTWESGASTWASKWGYEVGACSTCSFFYDGIRNNLQLATYFGTDTNWLDYATYHEFTYVEGMILPYSYESNIVFTASGTTNMNTTSPASSRAACGACDLSAIATGIAAGKEYYANFTPVARTRILSVDTAVPGSHALIIEGAATNGPNFVPASGTTINVRRKIKGFTATAGTDTTHIVQSGCDFSVLAAENTIYSTHYAYVGNASALLVTGSAGVNAGTCTITLQTPIAGLTSGSTFEIRNYLSPAGYYVLPYGVDLWWKKYGYQRDKDMVYQLAFSHILPPHWNYTTIKQREVAFEFDAAWIAQAEGLSTQAITDQHLALLLMHIDQIVHTPSPSQAAPAAEFVFFEPFMMGLQADALIRYYDAGHADPRIPVAIQRLADYAWTIYNSPQYPKAFPYSSGDWAIGAQHVASDMQNLNLLVVQMYGWLFKHTGDATYQTRGDMIWDDAVTGATWTNDCIKFRGKCYTQNFSRSVDYVGFRTAPAGVTLTSVTVAPVTPSIVNGTTQQMTATAHYSDGNFVDVTSSAAWSSTNTGVATVNASGVVTSVTAGTSTISATYNSLSDSTLATVTAAPNSVPAPARMVAVMKNAVVQ